MHAHPAFHPQLRPALARIAATTLTLLIALCLVWELWLAPLRPGGSYLALKVLPLLLALRGVIAGRVYTMQWACMLVLLYFMEGVVRAWSDPAPASVWMACVEIVLSFTFYLCALLYLRPAKQAAKQAAKRRAQMQAADTQQQTQQQNTQPREAHQRQAHAAHPTRPMRTGAP